MSPKGAFWGPKLLFESNMHSCTRCYLHIFPRGDALRFSFFDALFEIVESVQKNVRAAGSTMKKKALSQKEMLAYTLCVCLEPFVWRGAITM